MLSHGRLNLNAEKWLYEGVILPTVLARVLVGVTVLYGSETFCMRGSKRRSVNVLEMKCLWRVIIASRMD